jgi:hypothetical protein
MNIERLKDFFSPEDLEWKPIAITKDKRKALAAAYITNRAICDRLDDVCGPMNWRNEFRPGPGGGVVCGISIRSDDGEWVTKWDGAENTDIEPVKGGLTGSMKRAASIWGIGRYLYSLPQLWVPVDERGRFAQDPKVPSQFLPRGKAKPAPKPQPLDPDRQAFIDAIEAAGLQVFGDAWDHARERGCLTVSEGRAERPEDLSPDEAEALFELLESAAKAEQG